MTTRTEKKITPYFDVHKVTRDEILHIIQMYYPRGSGPLHTMHVTCRLLVDIAKLKGFDPFTEEELEAYPNRDFYKSNESARHE